MDEFCIRTSDLAGGFVGEAERSLHEVFVLLALVTAFEVHSESNIETDFSCLLRAAEHPRSLPSRCQILGIVNGGSSPRLDIFELTGGTNFDWVHPSLPIDLAVKACRRGHNSWAIEILLEELNHSHLKKLVNSFLVCYSSHKLCHVTFVPIDTNFVRMFIKSIKFIPRCPCHIIRISEHSGRFRTTICLRRNFSIIFERICVIYVSVVNFKDECEYVTKINQLPGALKLMDERILLVQLFDSILFKLFLGC